MKHHLSAIILAGVLLTTTLSLKAHAVPESFANYTIAYQNSATMPAVMASQSSLYAAAYTPYPTTSLASAASAAPAPAAKAASRATTAATAATAAAAAATATAAAATARSSAATRAGTAAVSAQPLNSAQRAALATFRDARAAAEAKQALNTINVLAAPEFERTELLQAVQSRLQPLLGHAIDAPLLQRVLNEVTRYYRDELGFSGAQAYLPAQAISSGELDLIVASTALRELRVDNQSSVNSDYLDYLLSEVYESRDKPIKESELQSSLLRLTDLGVFDIKGTFDTVDQHGFYHDLDLKATDTGHMFGFSLFADNGGTESSGRYRFGGQLQTKSLLGLAEKMSLFYARTDEQQNNYSFNVEVPINSHPTVLGFDFCYSDYELNGLYRELGAQGDSYTFEAYVQEPLYRTPTASSLLRTGVRYRDLEDEFSRFDLSFNKHTVSGYAQFYGYALFGEKQRSMLSYSQRFTYGRLFVDDDWGITDENNFVVSNTELAFSTDLTEHLRSTTSLSVQLASTELEGSDQFLAGGERGLGALESSDLAGDSGVVISEHLAFRPSREHKFFITPHVEYGYVTTKGYDYDEDAFGAGLSIDYLKQGLSLHLDLSHVLGSTPMYAEDEGRINFTVSYTFY